MKLMSKIKNEVEIKVNLFPASPKVAESGKDESPGFNGNENDGFESPAVKDFIAVPDEESKEPEIVEKLKFVWPVFKKTKTYLTMCLEL